MLGKGQLAAFTANTSTWYPLNYSLSFLSFPCHPSTIKLYSGTTEISGWTSLLENEREPIYPRAHSYPDFPCGGKPGLRSKEINQSPSLGRRQNLNPSLPNALRDKSASRDQHSLKIQPSDFLVTGQYVRLTNK